MIIYIASSSSLSPILPCLYLPFFLLHAHFMACVCVYGWNKTISFIKWYYERKTQRERERKYIKQVIELRITIWSFLSNSLLFSPLISLPLVLTIMHIFFTTSTMCVLFSFGNFTGIPKVEREAPEKRIWNNCNEATKVMRVREREKPLAMICNKSTTIIAIAIKTVRSVRVWFSLFLSLSPRFLVITIF